MQRRDFLKLSATTPLALSGGLIGSLATGSTAAASATALNLRVLAETATVITLGWDAQPGQEGYVTTLDGTEKMGDGKRHVSISQTATSVRIGKPQDGKPHTYGVEILGVGSSGSLTRPLPAVPAPSSSAPFGPNSAINKPIPASVAIHPDSYEMIQNNPWWVITPSSPDPNNVGVYNYREFIGPRERSYFAKVDASTKRVQMWRNYGDPSANPNGYGCATVPLTVPMPDQVANALAKGDNDIASYDRTVYMVDTSTGIVHTSYRTTPPGWSSKDISCDSSRWNTVRWDELPGGETTYVGYGGQSGSSGSGITIGCGAIRPEDLTDLSPGSVIPHAIRVLFEACPDGSLASHPQFVPPATGGGNDGQFMRAAGISQIHTIPTGARLQLDPAVDTDNHPVVAALREPWRGALRKILRTMKVFGCIYVDGVGGPGGGGYETWVAQTVLPYVYPNEAAGYGWSYAPGLNVPYDLMGKFRVVDWNKWTGV